MRNRFGSEIGSVFPIPVEYQINKGQRVQLAQITDPPPVSYLKQQGHLCSGNFSIPYKHLVLC